MRLIRVEVVLVDSCIASQVMDVSHCVELHDDPLSTEGIWCCGNVCKTTYHECIPNVGDVCSYEHSPDKWWFIAKRGQHLLLFFPGQHNCSQIAFHHYNVKSTSSTQHLMRLVIFSFIVLTPAILTIVSPL